MLGQWNGVDCEVWELSPECRSMEGFASDGSALVLLLESAMSSFRLASRAVQMLEWQTTHRYCGACGAATESADR